MGQMMGLLILHIARKGCASKFSQRVLKGFNPADPDSAVRKVGRKMKNLAVGTWRAGLSMPVIVFAKVLQTVMGYLNLIPTVFNVGVPYNLEVEADFAGGYKTLWDTVKAKAADAKANSKNIEDAIKNKYEVGNLEPTKDDTYLKMLGEQSSIRYSLFVLQFIEKRMEKFHVVRCSVGWILAGLKFKIGFPFSIELSLVTKFDENVMKEEECKGYNWADRYYSEFNAYADVEQEVIPAENEFLDSFLDDDVLQDGDVDDIIVAGEEITDGEASPQVGKF